MKATEDDETPTMVMTPETMLTEAPMSPQEDIQRVVVVEHEKVFRRQGADLILEGRHHR